MLRCEVLFRLATSQVELSEAREAPHSIVAQSSRHYESAHANHYVSTFRSGFRRWCGKGLQFFARFETHGFARRDANLLSGAGVTADARLARLYVEDAEPAQLDALAAAERILHGLEDG